MKPTRIEFIKENDLFEWKVGENFVVTEGYVTVLYSRSGSEVMLIADKLVIRGYAKYVEPKKKYGEIEPGIEFYHYRGRPFRTSYDASEFFKLIDATYKIWLWCEDCKKENIIISECWEIIYDFDTQSMRPLKVYRVYRTKFLFASEELAQQCIVELREEWLIYFGV